MSTHYIVAFDKDGWIQGIQSLSNGRTRRDIKHPVKGDTFTFIIEPPPDRIPIYKSVRVYTGTDIGAPDLFDYPTKANHWAYVPFGTILKVTYNSVLAFSFKPNINDPGPETSTDGDPDPDPTAPPDTGTIKVGG